MAKQTIIVMSDSHGDSLIVEEIRNRYVGKVDAVFHNGDSELRPDSPLWLWLAQVRKAWWSKPIGQATLTLNLRVKMVLAMILFS